MPRELGMRFRPGGRPTRRECRRLAGELVGYRSSHSETSRLAIKANPLSASRCSVQESSVLLGGYR